MAKNTGEESMVGNEYEQMEEAREGQINKAAAVYDKALRAEGNDSCDFLPYASDDRNSKKRSAQDQEIWSGIEAD